MAVALFLQNAQLPEPSPILDLGCGAGRHAIALAQAGYTVTGLDLAPQLLSVARETSRSESTPIHLVRGDMKHLPFRNAFAGIVQLFTAFGYFDDDVQNERVISEVARALKPGGIYLLDFLNAPQVVANLVPESTSVLDGMNIVQRRAIQGGRVNKAISIAGNDGREEVFSESVRLYDRSDLHSMFERQGLSVMQVFGDYHGNAWTAKSPRCILLGRLG